MTELESYIRHNFSFAFINLPDKQVTQWIGTAGYFMTDLHAFMYRIPSRFNIQALPETRLFSIDYEGYLAMGRLIPKWHEFEKLLMGKCFVMLENRVFDLISMSAEERYQKLFDQNRELFNLVPLQYLASMMGMTPETFSRIQRKIISCLLSSPNVYFRIHLLVIKNKYYEPGKNDGYHHQD
jgi:hypothetical protein